PGPARERLHAVPEHILRRGLTVGSSLEDREGTRNDLAHLLHSFPRLVALAPAVPTPGRARALAGHTRCTACTTPARSPNPTRSPNTAPPASTGAVLSRAICSTFPEARPTALISPEWLAADPTPAAGTHPTSMIRAAAACGARSAAPGGWRASSAPLAGSIRRTSPGSLAITRSPSSVSASRAYWKEPSNRQRGLPSSGARHHVSAMPETITPPSGSTVTASFHGP